MDSQSGVRVGATDKKSQEAEHKLEEEEERVELESYKEDVTPARKRPRDRRSGANFLSRVLFVWLDALFCTGVKRDLQEDDLSLCPEEVESERLYKKFNKHWQFELERHNSGKKPRLFMALIKTSWWRFILQGILITFEVILLNCQPIVLGYLSGFFAQLGTLNLAEQVNNTECYINVPLEIVSTRDAYLFAGGLVFLGLLSLLVHAHAFLIGQKMGMLWRVTATTAIHKKLLSLSQVTIGKISAGHVINLSSNDVHRFDMALLFFHYVWIAPFQVTAFCYLIYVEFGWSAFIGVFFMILTIFTQFFAAKLYAYYRFKAARITDKRVRVMNEVVVGIRVIKMYAWEYAFKRVVKALRKSEVLQVFKGGVVRAVSGTFIYGGARLIIVYLIVLPFILSGNTLTPKSVITTLSLINVIRLVFIIFVVRCFFVVYEAYVAIVRIQDFLLLEELPPADEEGEMATSRMNSQRRDSRVKILSGESSVAYSPHTTVHLLGGESRKVCVDVSGLSASWSMERDKQVLTDISFQVDQVNSLLAIVGPVGAGKSTLLQCLLGELQGIEGIATVCGALSYTSQEPWIFSGTLRENILFGSPHFPDRYDEVIRACTLDKDLKLFMDGDLTLVGERGVTLSGGQKARVSLARAVYRQADIYLLDDPLSAVDTVVAKHLFERCIRGLLKDKIVILVTHQVQFALEADKLLGLKEGRIEMYGTHAELAARGVDTNALLGLLQEGEAGRNGTGKDKLHSVPNPLDNPTPRRRRKQLDSESLNELHDIDEASIYMAPSLLSLHSVVDTVTSGQDDIILEQQGPPSEERAHGTVSMKTYYKYFRAGGNFLFLSVILVIIFAAEGGVVLSDWWLTSWANCDIQKVNSSRDCTLETNTSLSELCQLSNNTRLWIFTALIAIALLLFMIRAVLVYALTINSSRVLHNRMFASVLRAPARFFDTNPSGRVLNRFSKDIGFLDDLLPIVFFEFIERLIRFLAILIISIAANPWLAIVAAAVMVVFVFFRWYYLKTARDVKRLEAIARSPIYSHISTTLQGLPIIRTFQKQDIAQRHLCHHQDVHSEGWYAYLVTARWFAMRIDLLSAGFLAFVVFTSIPLASELSAELVGLSLVYAVSLSGQLQYCIRQSAEMENIMISTERILGYSRLESEASLETILPNHKPSPEWPEEGRIKMENVSFQYSPELPLVLKDLNLTIQPGEKVGVVGRTGAGKSSLLSVLYRLAEPSGVITIDGVDVQSIGLHDLRNKMSIIPQDPVLFSGTMRYNLDPFNEFSDNELWNVLEQVQLKGAVEQLEGQLAGEVSEGGSNFSVGQKQLVCLARALLRKNKILILDEATANVDPRTDEIIQQALRKKFTQCTVITIAHRLNTIMDSDRILVMSNGRLEEFDQPLSLLENSDSLLSKMVAKTGPVASRKLRLMAEDATRRQNSVFSLPL
ncbi:ATP-binding cassette sub-family C member 4-like isoform X1 [Halichondria panicea]|uniref:ATP-binding cassette sub-family C member 4-like isoform X1 n=1 Tax=Halichondria panicea TaxID=6063 RepID=UPI00312BA9F5